MQMESFPLTCFPLEIFVSPSSVEKFKCNIGNNILNNPVINKHGQNFCLFCIENEKNQAEAQQKEKEDDEIESNASEVFFPNEIIKDFIEQSEVKCLNFNLGCEYVTNLKNLKDHFENDCMLKIKKCSFESCQFKAEKRHLAEHEEFCIFREIDCEFCKERIIAKDQADHLQVCEMFEVNCGLECGDILPRKNLEFHMKKRCEKADYKCGYDFLGCEFSGKRSDFIEHLIIDNETHIDAIKQELKFKTEKCQNFELENEGLLKELNEYEAIKSSELENVVNEKNNKINEITASINNLSNLLAEKNELLEIMKKREQENKEKIEAQDNIITELKLQLEAKSRMIDPDKFEAYKPYLIFKAESLPLFFTCEGEEPDENSNFIQNNIFISEKFDEYKFLYNGYFDQNKANNENYSNSNTLIHQNYNKGEDNISLNYPLKIHKFTLQSSYQFIEKMDFSINSNLKNKLENFTNFPIADFDYDKFENIYAVCAKTCMLTKFDKSFNFIKQQKLTEEVSHLAPMPTITVSKVSKSKNVRILLTFRDYSNKNEKGKTVVKFQIFDEDLNSLSDFNNFTECTNGNYSKAINKYNNAVIFYPSPSPNEKLFLQFLKKDGRLGANYVAFNIKAYFLRVCVSKKDSNIGLLSAKEQNGNNLYFRKFDFEKESFINEIPYSICMDWHGFDEFYIGVNKYNYIILSLKERVDKFKIKYYDWNLEKVEDLYINVKNNEGLNCKKAKYNAINILGKNFIITNYDYEEEGHMKYLLYDRKGNLLRSIKCKAANSVVKIDEKDNMYVLKNKEEISTIKNFI